MQRVQRTLGLYHLSRAKLCRQFTVNSPACTVLCVSVCIRQLTTGCSFEHCVTDKADVGFACEDFKFQSHVRSSLGSFDD